MATNGIRTADIATTSTVDSIIGNSAGSTVVIPLAGLVAQVMALIGPPFTTLAQLNADLNWVSGSVGAVYGDAIVANNGVYTKTGASGEGSWTRIGDLAITTIAQQFISDLQAHLGDDLDPHGLVTMINALSSDLSAHGHSIEGIDGLAESLDAFQGINVKANDRPGDAPHSFSGTLTGSAEGKEPLSNAPVVVSGLGLAYPLVGANVLARRDPIALGNDVWEFSARLARTSNPADPNNHSLELRAAWLDGSKALLSDQALQSKTALLTSDGIVSISARVSATAVDDVIAPPSNAVYAVPYIKTYGDDGTTAVSTLRASEITDLHGVASVDFSQLLADVQAAMNAANTAAELVATETLETIGDVTTYSRAADVGVISLKGGSFAFDGGGGQWAYDPADTTTPQELPWIIVGADGARYRRSESASYDSVSGLKDSNEPSRGPLSKWETEDGHHFLEADVGASDHDMENAAGVKLYLEPSGGGYSLAGLGAVGDGVTSDVVAFTRALALQDRIGGHMVFTGTAGMVYLIDSMVQIAVDGFKVDLRGAKVKTSGDITAFEVGEPAGSSVNTWKRSGVFGGFFEGSGAGKANNHAIVVRNHSYGVFAENSFINFGAKPIALQAHGRGVQYNEFHNSELMGNHDGAILLDSGTAAGGYVNDNLFVNVRAHENPRTNPPESSGVTHVLFTGSGEIQGNRMPNCGFETQNDNDIILSIEKGEANLFVPVRLDGTDNCTALSIAAGCNANSFYLQGSQGVIDDRSGTSKSQGDRGSNDYPYTQYGSVADPSVGPHTQQAFLLSMAQPGSEMEFHLAAFIAGGAFRFPNGTLARFGDRDGGDNAPIAIDGENKNFDLATLPSMAAGLGPKIRWLGQYSSSGDIGNVDLFQDEYGLQFAFNSGDKALHSSQAFSVATLGTEPAAAPDRIIYYGYNNGGVRELKAVFPNETRKVIADDS